MEAVDEGKVGQSLCTAWADHPSHPSTSLASLVSRLMAAAAAPERGEVPAGGRPAKHPPSWGAWRDPPGSHFTITVVIPLAVALPGGLSPLACQAPGAQSPCSPGVHLAVLLIEL